MNKVLGFVVLLTFIFSSCASAPVINHSQKQPVQLRVSYPQNGFTNNVTSTVKDYEFHIDLKASEPTDGPGTGVKRPSAVKTVLIIVFVAGVAAAAGYFLYDYITNPDSILKK